MLIDDDRPEARLTQSSEDPARISEADASEKMAAAISSAPIPSESDLFDLYEKIAETRPGTRDAEIFEKIHEWSFSDFSIPPHEFAGITKIELSAWQTRHRINLSAGHIRPARIDLDRGYAWGHMRRVAHVNGIHSHVGPPSAAELREIIISTPA
jgi:hypothetical protein